jgi:hypothetical protein
MEHGLRPVSSGQAQARPTSQNGRQPRIAGPHLRQLGCIRSGTSAADTYP